ncbi:UDP-2,4-diacetamido-2,4,6-trideoxy-beta-L-altropyranose hydrolase [Bradyrhizobium jicamae]|uniref:UDP-2,4-diacetamido-2,4, 6-trideoxy-beta-L-altropyranose hydrolase n=1 Tax=Bradyrhizobium jicamae TaxID=280332 RepID=UPI001BAA45BD|nr:UDP-2,4-diacetamido-2,4,6-trideoxy-beta-L-altropyranose hydrolase [Bradyrhizobium jicamae]MBR0757037.1 UDP-2,4-diacetamido-2,4,6-trideoxy-beta-L-altropyranose hydrolase [Bradyrhizobium jicamae]
MSAAKRVVFRVDASIEMGMGHLMRCLCLANALAEGGTRALFLIRSHAAKLATLIEANGHAVRPLPDPEQAGAATSWLPTSWQHDAEQTGQAISEAGAADWLVVDHYGLDARWERLQRTQVPRILVIDDVADRPHDCDLLLDQNLVAAMETRYAKLVGATCMPLLGPRYALLRPQFAEARRQLPPRSDELRRILICHGGSDPTNETAKALTAIRHLAANGLAVDVVIGPSNPHGSEVAALCQALPDVELHRGADDMAGLMARADLAIGAGGIMNWERCCLGLPTIATAIADNQVGGLTALARAGAVDYLGHAGTVDSAQLADAIAALRRDAGRVRAMGAAALSLVDGQGADRVRAAMSSLPF